MMTRGHVGIAILAAGGSHRMRWPKQLLPFRERTLARHAAETAVASRCRPIVVVIGANAELIRDELVDIGLPSRRLFIRRHALLVACRITGSGTLGYHDASSPTPEGPLARG